MFFHIPKVCTRFLIETYPETFLCLHKKQTTTIKTKKNTAGTTVAIIIIFRSGSLSLMEVLRFKTVCLFRVVGEEDREVGSSSMPK